MCRSIYPFYITPHGVQSFYEIENNQQYYTGVIDDQSNETGIAKG